MAQFTHLDSVYELVQTSEWTWVEGRQGKQASGGMSVVEIGQRATLGDPDALIALIVVSIMRVRPAATAEKIVQEIEASGQRMLAFVDQISAEQVSGDDPPAGAAEEAATSATTTTPDDSGDQSSDT